MSGRFATAAVGLGLLLGTAATGLAEEATAPSMDARVARCVLKNVALARSKAAAELVAEACRALIQQTAGDPADESFALIKCFVLGDPEWVEFRLLTRAQCSNAAGITGG